MLWRPFALPFMAGAVLPSFAAQNIAEVSLATLRPYGKGGRDQGKDGGVRGCRCAAGFGRSSAPSVFVGVGNGGIWENHFCTGDVHGAGVVGVRERLSVAGGRMGGRSLGCWRGPARGFGDLPASPVPS